ncbi:MAG: ribosome silencing factor [Eubacterium sp.]|nr:ribosome silencing factor [Eubacterium sp.]
MTEQPKDSLNKARIAYSALDEKLGLDIRVLKIDEISVIADYMVIASGDNPNQIRAMIDMVEERMAEAGYKSGRIEGNKNSTWILMDYEDVIVHIFSKDDRLFYDLERIWRDGQVIDLSDKGHENV